MSESSSSAVDGLYFRWKAFRVAGKPVDPAVLCRDRPELCAALEARIAVEHSTDEPQATGVFTPKPMLEEAEGTGDYCPTPPPDVVPPQPASGAARYDVVAVHAEGGMGRVSVAVDTELNRRVAFKDIKPRFADDEVARHRFTREALITGQLEHPGVIPVYGLGADASGRPFYAMRFIEGQSLKDAVRAFHAVPPKRDPAGPKAVEFRGLLKRFADVCNAVAFAHSKGIVHRDLKPANVMLGPFGETLVVDWGLARSFADKRPDASAEAVPPPVEGGAAETVDLAPADREADTLGTRTGAVMGTPAYMSPEQAAGDLPTLGPAWDIYSLGATLYEVLTGRAPFGGKPARELFRDIQAGAFAPPRAAAPWVPGPLDAVVRKAMAHYPEDRYATALDLAADVERYLADERVAAHRETVRERARRWAKRHPALVRTVAALFLFGTPALALAFGVVYYQKDRAQEAERLKDGALKREEAAHATGRQALRLTEQALEGETRGLEQVRATLDLTTDELVGKVLAKQSKLGDEEREFLARLIANYSRFGSADDTRPEKRLLAARAQLRVAQIRDRLGDTAAAASGYRDAVAALRPSAETAVPDSAASRDLATALLGLARTTARTDVRTALEALAEGLKIRLAALEGDRGNLDKIRENGLAMLQGAEMLAAAGRTAQAEGLYREFLRTHQALALRGTLGAEMVEAVGRAYDRLADVHLAKAPPRYDLAYAELDGAVGLFGALERKFPSEPRYRHLRAAARSVQAGLLHRDGKTEEAEGVLVPLIAAHRELTRQFPAVREYRQGLAAALATQSAVLVARGKSADAARALDEARGALARLHTDYPEFGAYRESLVTTLRELARVNRALGRVDAAVQADADADAFEGEAPKK